uniref:Chitin-binding type-4 domain-containing protein n=1 Tax=Homona coffearia entomopoxvirus TaxID=1365471 RepID=W0T2I7_9POXV|nr:hypothetical protein [Homona coffearia entomopoxvirus]
MFKIVLILSLTNLLYEVNGHGYMTFPIARQRRCSTAGGYWWPPNVDGIQDTMCRYAYKNVYNKVLNQYNSESQAATAAQYMFVQDNEYAALAGNRYTDICYVQQYVVPNYLCGAGASDWSIVPFGDKSGMDLPGSWVPTVIPLYDNHQTNVALELEFCPTAIHEPSYYEVYITNPSFNVHIDNVVWGNLELIYNNTVPLRAKLAESTCVANSMVYRFTVPIPVRSSQFVLYVRWQRNDPVGEGFYNCVDMAFEYAEGPDEEDVIEPEEDIDSEITYECNAAFSGGTDNSLNSRKYQSYLSNAVKSNFGNNGYCRHSKMNNNNRNNNNNNRNNKNKRHRPQNNNL